MDVKWLFSKFRNGGIARRQILCTPLTPLSTLSQIPRVSLLVMICFHHASGRLISFATLFFQQLAEFIASFFPDRVRRNGRCLRKIDIINQIPARVDTNLFLRYRWTAYASMKYSFYWDNSCTDSLSRRNTEKYAYAFGLGMDTGSTYGYFSSETAG